MKQRTTQTNDVGKTELEAAKRAKQSSAKNNLKKKQQHKHCTSFLKGINHM
jgi:hypothetical protein